MTKTWPQISDDPAVQAFYEASREAGESHNIAEMCALRQTPGSQTDREFMAGRMNGEQFAGNPALGNYYRRIAEAHGCSTTGKTYLSQLADFPGDPKAWVGSRADVEKVCLQTGAGCSGMVNVKVSEREPTPAVDVADDILEERADKAIELDPGLASKNRSDLKEEIKEKIKPHWTD